MIYPYIYLFLLICAAVAYCYYIYRSAKKPIAEPARIPRGFKKHDGVKCPIGLTQRISAVMFRDGEIQRNFDIQARNFRWLHDGSSSDIIAYRLRKPRAMTKKRRAKK